MGNENSWLEDRVQKRLRLYLKNYPNQWVTLTGRKLRFKHYNSDDKASDNFKRILSEKQLNIYEVAKRKGYFEYPRRMTQCELAKYLETSASTLNIHMQKIQSKAMEILRWDLEKR